MVACGRHNPLEGYIKREIYVQKVVIVVSIRSPIVAKWGRHKLFMVGFFV